MNRLYFGISAIAILLLTGAGCTNPATPTSELSTKPNNVSGSQEKTNHTTRVPVPALGFSYVSLYSDPEKQDGAHTVGNRLNFGDGATNFIERITTKTGENFAKSIETFAATHGALDTRCSLTMETATDDTAPFLSPGMQIGYIMPRLVYKPTTAQIYSYLRTQSGRHAGATDKELAELCNSSPECDFAASEIKIREARKACGEYTTIPGERIIAFFIASKDSTAPILFAFSSEGRGGGAAPFSGGPIEFLK
jgi:hypothetical protein